MAIGSTEVVEKQLRPLPHFDNRTRRYSSHEQPEAFILQGASESVMLEDNRGPRSIKDISPARVGLFGFYV